MAHSTEKRLTKHFGRSYNQPRKCPATSSSLQKQFDQARFLEQVAQFQEALKQHGLKGLNQRIILRFIHDRDAPVTEVDKNGTFMVGKGEKFRLFRGSLSETTGELTVKLLMSKKLTCDILRDANIPTTDPQFVYSPQDILDFAAENSYLIVLKPNNTNGNIAYMQILWTSLICDHFWIGSI